MKKERIKPHPKSKVSNQENKSVTRFAYATWPRVLRHTIFPVSIFRGGVHVNSIKPENNTLLEVDCKTVVFFANTSDGASILERKV